MLSSELLFIQSILSFLNDLSVFFQEGLYLGVALFLVAFVQWIEGNLGEADAKHEGTQLFSGHFYYQLL